MSLSDRSINKDVPIPMYYQLKEFIIDEIQRGNLMPGDSIPTEIELSQMFRISRTTVRQAVIELVRDGYLYRVKGKGTFVAKPKIMQDFMRKLETFADQMKRLGMTPKTKVLECKMVRASEKVADALEVAKGENVIKLVRLRFANDEPIVLVDSYLPSSCACVLDHDMEKESLYDVLSKDVETKVCRVIRQIEATTAGQLESDLMNIKRGYPIQLTTTIAYNQNGRPMEYSIARYRGDKNKFIVELSV